MQENPYQSPVETPDVYAQPRDNTRVAVRIAAGIMAISGLIYLPTAIWLVTLPGAVLWFGWVTVAAYRRTQSLPWFWIASFGWNGMMAALLFQPSLDGRLDAPVALVPLIHSVVAAVVSLVLLLFGRHWFTAMPQLSPGSVQATDNK